jgi:hypothetical protein
MRKTIMKLSDNFGQSIDFDIDPKFKKIGINLSGGADSAILFYMICDYLKENDRPDVSVSVMSCANDLKHRWNPRKAADIINYTIDKLNFNPVDIHYSYYRDVQHVSYFREIEQKLYADNRIDLIVGGITANPLVNADVEDSESRIINLNETGLSVRNTEGTATTMSIGSNGCGYYMPFINHDKRFVAAMYDHYGVLEELLPLTRSCEAIPDGDFDPAFENESCGTCWWCLERKWAFGVRV